MKFAVVAFWSNDKFRVAEVTPDLKSVSNRPYREKYPERAALIEKDIENGALNEKGVYRFIEDQNGKLLGYEQLNDI